MAVSAYNRPGGFQSIVFSAAALLAACTATHPQLPAELPPMPPDAPQADEVVVDDPNDSVVVNCAKYADAFKRIETITKVVVTRSKKWGTIWRADVSATGYNPPILSRIVCWNSGPGRAISVEHRPLEMFDPSKSIPRL